MLCAVSGHTVVHSESWNDSMTTLPRNWLSDIGWPNWFSRAMSGAGCPPSELPRSRFGFISAAPDTAAPGMPAGELALVPHPASAVSPARTVNVAAAASMPCGRAVFIATTAYCVLLRAIAGLADRGPGRTRLPARVPRLVSDDHRAAVTPGDVPEGQVDQRRHAVPPAEQVDQVQGEPGQPGERAAQPQPAQPAGQLDHGGPAPDRGQDALVVVGERLGRQLALEPDDLGGGMAPHLNGRLGQL